MYDGDMPTSNDLYDFLVQTVGYNINVAQDLCNFFDSAKLMEFCEFLADEIDATLPWADEDEEE